MLNDSLAEVTFKSVKLTRAWANSDRIQDNKDQVDLKASGTSPHLLTDVFYFSDFFFL